MKVEGVYSFPGPPQKVWDLLLDPESLRQCIPGVESLTETGPDHYDAVMKVGVRRLPTVTEIFCSQRSRVPGW